MAIIATNVQTLWKDSCASLPTLNLTVRVNGEEQPQLITSEGAMVRAGFAAPATLPTCAAGTAGGVMTSGKFVAYAYVYASSKYPGIDNAVTGQSGELFPRSNPSPNSAVFTVTATGKVDVVCTKTDRSDVDRIWLYRTAQKDTSADATVDANAGVMFYVGFALNDGIPGSVTITDNTTEGTEQLENDNFPMPNAQFVVYDGAYCWAFGNNEMVADVTLDASTNIVLNDATITKWFTGRDSQIAQFDGIDTGGFDSRGSFYFKATSNTTATLYSDSLLTVTSAAPASGTATMRLKGPATSLYRSKPNNPFSWGWTEQLSADDGTVSLVPQEWALKVGGGVGTGISLIPTDSVMFLYTEGPTRAYRLSLTAADSPASMSLTKQTVDDQHSISSHFTLFPGVLNDRSVQIGIDGKSFAVLANSPDTQSVISGPIQQTMRRLKLSDRQVFKYHGNYDPKTELNCFWVKLFPDVADAEGIGWGVHDIDTMLYVHGPTGTWGMNLDPDITASASVYDPVERETFLLLGTENGGLCRGFSPSWDTETSVNPEPGTYQRLGGAQFLFNNSTCVFGRCDFNTGGTLTIFGDFRVASVTAATNSVMTLSAVSDYLTEGDVIGVTSTGGTLIGEFVVSRYDRIAGGATLATTQWYLGANIGTAISNGWMIPAFSNMRSVFLTDDNKAHSMVMGYTGAVSGGGANSLGMGILINNVVRYDIIAGELITTTPDYIECYLGATPAVYRIYLDGQQPDMAKKVSEIWASLENVSPLNFINAAPDNLYLSFYREYSDTPALTFTPTRDKILTTADTPDSLNWFDKTQLPSSIVRQFGLQIVECGLYDFRIYNLTPKAEPAR